MTQSMFHIEWGISVEKKGDSQPLFEQVHGTNILELGSPPDPQARTTPIQADGVVASYPKAELYIYTADCLPLLFFTEEENGPIAAIHAGWKGARLGIIQKTFSMLSHHPSLHVIIGPAIGACCFAVREDFINEWETAGLSPQRYLSLRGNRYYFDLVRYAVEDALKPLPRAQIHLDWFRCTVCSTPSLPSFRRNKSANPRLRTWIRKP
ncbi:laccase domain-containing protein [bacterium]|nr:laccase domain-containing protein [bacterium]